MIVYNYDKDTKEYIGEESAILDRVTSMRLGFNNYFIPANATVKAPLPAKEGYAVIFNGYEWEYIEDHRGKIAYRITDRAPKEINFIGELPSGYTLNLPEYIEEIRNEYLFLLKNSFTSYIETNTINIKSLGVEFTYGDLNNLQNERDLGILVSRDANNKIYSFTKEDYDLVIEYLKIYGQYLYLLKWEKEADIKAFKDIDLLKKYQKEIVFDVPEKTIDNLVKMPEEKRNKYFIRLSNNITNK